ncbi:MAG: 5-aminolevulinate synthase [Gaiellales bacterium]|nr:5-aminolevulinate synthase [Gaiellales bacterium]
MGTSPPAGAVRAGHPALAAALETLEQRLGVLREEGRYRRFVELERPATDSPYVRLADGSGRVVVDWCSNDYLGMSLHPAVVEAASRALAEHGVGSGGTRNIAGSHVLVRQLEDELADLHAQEAALVFTSGFIANEASLRALGSLLEGCVILSDQRNHASMIDGIRASGAERAIFRHNDLEHLRELLEALPPEQPRIVAFESIYSMDGDIAPLREICALAAEHGALTYLDETHAAGAYGREGAGVAQALGAAGAVTIVQGSLAKGYGTLGGFIAGPAGVIDSVRSHASGFIFTTSLPPAIAAAALASVRHLRASGAERAGLMRSVAGLRDAFARAGVEAMPSESHIVPVLVPGATRCREVAQNLLDEYSIYVQPINYPSVPRGGERLRIAPTPAHSAAHAEKLAAALASVLP